MNEAADAGRHERRQQAHLRRTCTQRREGQQTEGENRRQRRQRARAPGNRLANPARAAAADIPEMHGLANS
jgi:hypothetical protein